MIFENRFIYFPTRQFSYVPEDFGLEYEDVFINAEDAVKLHGWYFPCAGAKSAFLFFHGNAGNISDRLDNIIRLLKLVRVDVFIIDYHGFGRSEGSPNEGNLCMDGRAAMAELRRRLEGSEKKIIVFGRSLGGAVAIDLASKTPCDGLITESTFTSIPDVADALFPILPAGKIIRTKFDSINKIGGITAPKLFVHGDRDSLIPFSHAQKLFEAAAPPKEFYPVSGGDHNDTYLVSGDSYFARLAEFIRKIEVGKI